MPRSLAEAGKGGALGRGGGEALPMLATEVDVLKLTARQREVLLLLANGNSNKEIARALDIAEATTKIQWRRSCVPSVCATARKLPQSANLLSSKGVRLLPAA